MSGIDPYRLKISQLRILTTVASCQNFSEAALRLNISQSAVSHAISTLEAQLGVTLFNRGRNGAYPTHVGAQLVMPAQEILDLLQKIAQEANRAKGLDGGSVRLVSFRSAATHILPGLIAKFRDRFPAIDISVTEAEEDVGVENLLCSGKADLGFIHLPCSDKLETWEVYDDEYIVLLPKNLDLNHSQELSWLELAEFPLIIPAVGSCSTTVLNYLRRSPKPLNIAYEMREDSTMVSMAIQGLGAAILPKLAARPIPAELEIYSLPTVLKRTIKAAVLENALHTPAVFAFIDTLKNYTQDLNSHPISQK